MTYTFLYQSRSKKSTKRYAAFISDLRAFFAKVKPITTESTYNAFLSDVVDQIKKHGSLFTNHSALYKTEMGPILATKPLTERTPWGGVALKKVDVAKDYIRKLLVVGHHGILGFEIHEKKHEHLRVLEGVCLFIHSVHKDQNWKKGRVSLSIAQPGDTITLLPGDEHGIIALTDCVVEETSTNHLDDLIFLFNSIQVRKGL